MRQTNALTRHLVFLATGLISGLLSALVFFLDWLPQWLMDAYPGVVLGSCLYALLIWGARARARLPGFTWPLLTAFTVLGWRLAVHSVAWTAGPVFLFAGTIGAAVMALGVWLAVQNITRVAAWVALLAFAGGIGGLLFEWLDGLLDSAHFSWGLVLFCEWQALVLLGMSLAMQQRAGSIFSNHGGW